jgi:hypothetical protein
LYGPKPRRIDDQNHAVTDAKGLPIRLAEPKPKGFARWRGDEAARGTVTNNRARLLSQVARQAFKLRAEVVERSFAHSLDRGGMRRTWLRGRENVHKRYLLHVAGGNLSFLSRQLIGAGTPERGRGTGIYGHFSSFRGPTVHSWSPSSSCRALSSVSPPHFCPASERRQRGPSSTGC